MTKLHDRCLNCGAMLGGQYCGRCGQRATARLISLWELVRDAFGDLFELDSRLWRTLLPLLARPGRLTRDYLEGRRARYMPPFRMYLVLSLVFFVIAFFDPQRDYEILFAPDESGPDPGGTPPAETAPLEDLTPEERQEVREALGKLIDQGVLNEAVLDTRALDGLDSEADDADASPPPPAAPATDDDNFAFSIGEGGDGINCRQGEFDVSGFPDWLQRRLTPARLRHLCERWEVAGSEGLVAALLDRIPAALILLLPLTALVLKLLYPLSRRYYVEHLLFFVHFHSFLFLLLTLQILWLRLVTLLGLNAAIGVLPVVASSLYVPVYLFVAMRRVYGQGRFVTFLKFGVLVIAYVVSFSLMMLGALLLAVFSI